MTDALALTRTAAPYPADAVEMRALADGRPLLIRPLAARDAELLQDFIRGLSPHSRYQRFQSTLHELSPELLARLTNLDYQRSMAFAAIVFEHGHRRMVGEARYAPAIDRPAAVEFGLAVSDTWQRQGLGTLLLEKLIRHSERSGIALIQGDVLHDNAAMLRLTRQLGFTARTHPDGAWLTRVERTPSSLAIAA
jgi:acetyltransferase